jgi:uncharacterized protein (DUF433 family)
MALLDRIVVDSEVMFGKPRINGTRVTVETILRRMSEGDSVEDLLADYPHITDADVRAALAYARAAIAFDDTSIAVE